MQEMIIKVCGMRCSDNICKVEQLGVDLMGFIFYPKSPRFVKETPSYLPVKAKRVGVFVNEEIEVIKSKIEEFKLDFVQLHGGETPDFCSQIRDFGVKVIKAFSVSVATDFSACTLYDKVCDLFIFDTKCVGYGGSGESFDWNILSEYQAETPFLLSGGLGIENIDEVVRFSHPRLVGYDLNSRFEIEPALKDIKLIKKFLDKI